MPDQLDCVIVGAGVVGLAVARSLARAGREVVVLEAESEIGMHTSSRNSEVIHAGLYYGDDTLKARLCVEGRALLYQYCEDRQIPYKRIGKLIVASHKDERAKLEAIQTRALKNGVDDLSFVDSARIRELEPTVVCEAGLLSPSTGIVDSHSLMISLQADIEAGGGTVLTHSRIVRVEVTSSVLPVCALPMSLERFGNLILNTSSECILRKDITSRIRVSRRLTIWFTHYPLTAVSVYTQQTIWVAAQGSDQMSIGLIRSTMRSMRAGRLDSLNLLKSIFPISTKPG